MIVVTTEAMLSSSRVRSIRSDYAAGVPRRASADPRRAGTLEQ
jgi:hypothetical protein